MPLAPTPTNISLSTRPCGMETSVTTCPNAKLAIFLVPLYFHICNLHNNISTNMTFRNSIYLSNESMTDLIKMTRHSEQHMLKGEGPKMHEIQKKEFASVKILSEGSQGTEA